MLIMNIFLQMRQIWPLATLTIMILDGKPMYVNCKNIMLTMELIVPKKMLLVLLKPAIPKTRKRKKKRKRRMKNNSSLRVISQ